VTETLAGTTISIPFFRDIEVEQVDKIAAIILGTLDG
jgi:dTDP-4-amino-4,6-dideoxygalactose transaminase